MKILNEMMTCLSQIVHLCSYKMMYLCRQIVVTNIILMNTNIFRLASYRHSPLLLCSIYFIVCFYLAKKVRKYFAVPIFRRIFAKPL